ncbi:MAG TPA: hypothetical protein VGI82_11495 [Chitinophagaceae bacterium]|jgi:hypothetical protein
MTKILIPFFLFSSILCFGQKKEIMGTMKYAGYYSYGKNIRDKTGGVIVYPETDSTILFCIDLNRGVPSYNMGFAYGRLKIIKDGGIFYEKPDSAGSGCKWLFVFSKKNLTIRTLDHQYECGFGAGVFADGDFKRASSKIFEFFEDNEGRKFYFRQTSPEDYNSQ